MDTPTFQVYDFRILIPGPMNSLCAGNNLPIKLPTTRVATKSNWVYHPRLIVLRNKLIKRILGKIDNVQLNDQPEHGLPNNVNVSVDYIEWAPTCLNLNFEGICISTGFFFLIIFTKMLHHFLNCYCTEKVTLCTWLMDAT